MSSVVLGVRELFKEEDVKLPTIREYRVRHKSCWLRKLDLRRTDDRKEKIVAYNWRRSCGYCRKIFFTDDAMNMYHVGTISNLNIPTLLKELTTKLKEVRNHAKQQSLCRS